ncbi:efflux RND transporter periplasmic adaptor subunit [Parvibium lacunae]|uniref:Efflux RND transporter periplasmic adaptor subunit n=1 Tax=Parvibium lacunae TaxID=1888893 RepID=A0A368L256_9BURK|nr:efflux RND transporter periplasmic adaptor subunit [Parvibium lacunae]RCS57470.1 efflux RND transporter periplasmic adaptor subunit [Parvibium lacunae]
MRMLPLSRRWLLLMPLVIGLAACEKQAASDQPADKKSTASQAVRDLNTIEPTPALKEQLKIGRLSEAPYSELIRVAGRLEVNANQTSRIGSPMTGRITKITAQLGQQVRPGDVMAEVNSQELTAAQLAYLKAHSAEQVAARAVERAQLLLQADVIGNAELQRRQKELEIASAEKRAAADQLRVLGLSNRSVQQLASTGKIDSVAPITSPLAGAVIERNIAQGQVVQPSDSLFVVSDLRTLWAVAEVPEQEAGQVKMGQTVEIEVPALENKILIGKIVFIADVVNPETRTVRVSLVLDNAERLLKPAMLISMRIESKPVPRTMVPVTAVVRENDKDYVYGLVGTNQFKLVPVKLGVERNGYRPLLEQLPPGINELVIDGAFHLNNERNKQNLG